MLIELATALVQLCPIIVLLLYSIRFLEMVFTSMNMVVAKWYVFFCLFFSGRSPIAFVTMPTMVFYSTGTIFFPSLLKCFSSASKYTATCSCWTDVKPLDNRPAIASSNLCGVTL